MGKNAKLFSMILVLFFFFVPANADFPTFSLHAKIGRGSPVEGHIHSGFSGAFGLALHFDRQISVSIDIGSWRSPVDEKSDEMFEGKLTLIPILVSLKYFFSLENRVHPYVSVGGGYVFTRFRMDNIITIPEITISQEIRSGVGIHAGLGAVVKISKSFGLEAEGLYIFRNSKGVTTISDMNFGSSSEEFSVRLHTVLFQVGIIYFFD